MNSEKQIEEMYKDVYEAINHNAVIDITHGGYIGVNTDGLTRELYDDGYRKASEVALEVIGEVEKIIDKHYNKHIFGAYDLEDEEKEAVMNFSDDVTYEIDELKKKYTEGEG